MEAPAKQSVAGLSPVILPLFATAALLCAWFFFYIMGQSLLRLKG
jgi:hypothetical protein